jgi:hypothetical protein
MSVEARVRGTARGVKEGEARRRTSPAKEWPTDGNIEYSTLTSAPRQSEIGNLFWDVISGCGM